MKSVPERVSALRAEMKKEGVNTYVVYSQDAHQSEYVADYWHARAYMSGFTGSAGTVMITETEAACWVDGRYFLQGEKQLEGSGITLMKMGEMGVPKVEEYLLDKTPEGGVVALDGRTIGSLQAKALTKRLAAKKIQLSCGEDLVGRIWDDRPSLPLDEIWDFPVELAGESRSEKLARVREHMQKIGASYYLMASLDSAAWLLNYRGNDIHCTPVAYAFVLVAMDKAYLFIEEAKVSDAMRQTLLADGVEVRPYHSLPSIWAELAPGKIGFDGKEINELLVESIPAEFPVVEEKMNIVVSMKAVKNETEQANVRKAHLKDAAVMIHFLRWVKAHASAGITECDAADYLDNLRCEQENSLGISFDTIAGYGPNGAIVHYKPERPGCAEIKPEGFLLVDSGAQYMEGTTDITRTIAMGPLTDEMKEAYTLVLKGHLALGRAIFPDGATGANIDVLARAALWSHCLDYKHGTGHGVGFVLSVHEGPQNISQALRPVKLLPGMVISDEPGYYPTGKFGVRIENLTMVMPQAENEWGKFYRNEPITFVPYEREAIVKELLTDEEIAQVNAYHAKCRELVRPYLKDEEDLKFLEEVTKEL